MAIALSNWLVSRVRNWGSTITSFGNSLLHKKSSEYLVHNECSWGIFNILYSMIFYATNIIVISVTFRRPSLFHRWKSDEIPQYEWSLAIFRNLWYLETSHIYPSYLQFCPIGCTHHRQWYRTQWRQVAFPDGVNGIAWRHLTSMGDRQKSHPGVDRIWTFQILSPQKWEDLWFFFNIPSTSGGSNIICISIVGDGYTWMMLVVYINHILQRWWDCTVGYLQIPFLFWFFPSKQTSIFGIPGLPQLRINRQSEIIGIYVQTTLATSLLELDISKLPPGDKLDKPT